MAITSFANGGYIPLFNLPQANGQVGSQTLNATGNNMYAVGEMILSSGPGTSKVFSTSSKMYIFLASGGMAYANAGTSTRFGIQDLSSGGPDGTFDVYKDLVGGGGGLSGGAINQISFDQGTKTIAYGQSVAVGLHMTTRAGVDRIDPSGCSAHAISEVSGRNGLPYLWYNGAKDTNQPLAAVLTSDDGTVGWVGNTILNAVDAPTFDYNSGSTPDEYALLFTPPFACRVCGVRVLLGEVDTTEDFDLHLYTTPTGTPSAAVTRSVTAVNLGSTVAGAAQRVMDFMFTASPYYYDLVGGTQYGLAVRPTTGNSFSLSYWDGAATYGATLRPHVTNLGTSASLGSRTDQTGSFAETTYRVPFITPLICGIDTGSGGGGYTSF